MSSHRRPSSPSRHRHSSSRRSPEPSRRRDRSRERSRERSPKPRSESELPTEFGGKRDEVEKGRPEDDDRNVLEKMEKAYATGPLFLLHQACKEHARLKIWTRNFKEIRGICTGFIVAFDKHWNLVLEDVDEVCLKPKKGKTPYLSDVGPDELDSLSEAKPPAPREKKKPAEPEPQSAESEPEVITVKEGEDSDAAATEGGKEKKKRKPRKKKKTRLDRRAVPKLFIRGDNVVMMSIMWPDDDDAAKEK